MSQSEIWNTTDNWWFERKSAGAHHYILRIMPFLFEIIDSLYIETRKLPIASSSLPINEKVGNSYNMIFGISMQPTEYIILRSVLSLVGDVYNFTTPLKNLLTI
jgi:hypothetical protein